MNEVLAFCTPPLWSDLDKTHLVKIILTDCGGIPRVLRSACTKLRELAKD